MWFTSSSKCVFFGGGLACLGPGEGEGPDRVVSDGESVHICRAGPSSTRRGEEAEPGQSPLTPSVPNSQTHQPYCVLRK